MRHRRATSEASRRLAKAKLRDYANGAVGHETVSLLFLPQAKKLGARWTLNLTTFGPLNRVCGGKSISLHSRTITPNKHFSSPSTNAPQTSGSNIALFVVSDRRIANNPKQICTTLPKRTQIPSPQPKTIP